MAAAVGADISEPLFPGTQGPASLVRWREQPRRPPVLLALARRFHRSVVPSSGPCTSTCTCPESQGILPSISSPLLFPHYANTLPADLTLSDAERRCVLPHPIASLPPWTRPRRPRLDCDYPSPLHCLCACFPRPGPCLSATYSSPPTLRGPVALLEGHAGHVHSGIGHLQKQSL